MFFFIKKKLFSIFIKESFNPSWIGLFINPFYITRRNLYKEIKEIAPTMSGKILDVGCGRKPYKHLFSCESYIGIDVNQDGHNHKDEDIDIFYDGKHIPFENNHFDSMLCSQVLEHVFHPNEFLSELNRVLKPNGKLLLTVPFVWDEHEQPYDYGRYSSFGLKDLLNKHNFEVLKISKSTNSIELIFQLLIAYIFKITFTNSKILQLLVTLILISPINIMSIIFAKITPKNNDLYLDNICLCKKNKNM